MTILNSLNNPELLENLKKRLCIGPKIPRDPKLGLDYQPDPDDIITLSFPRCGRSWLTHILWALNHDGDGCPKDTPIYKEYQWLEEVGNQSVKSCPRPRVVVTHLPMDLVPKHPQVKYMCVVRNPKDAIVSLCIRNFNWGFDKEIDFQKYVDKLLVGDIVSGCYFDHLHSYLPYLNNENFLLLFYEKMLAEPAKHYRKLADFMGKPHLTQEVIEKAVQNTAIDVMRTHQKRWAHNEIVAGGDGGAIRKGKVGEWRDHLTKHQSDAIDRKFYEEMKGTVAENWFQDAMKWEQE